MKTVPVYILAGGKSSRFGSDKARADFHGEPLLARIMRILKPKAESFTVVADAAEKYDDLGVRTITDERTGLGPIGGLHRALKDLPAPGWLLLVSCDFVVIDCAWVDKLLGATRGDSGCAIVFEGPKCEEPLFALYHTNILRYVEAAIARRQFSLLGLFERAPHTLLPMPAKWPKRAHVNTREELNRAKIGIDKN